MIIQGKNFEEVKPVLKIFIVLFFGIGWLLKDNQILKLTISGNQLAD